MLKRALPLTTVEHRLRKAGVVFDHLENVPHVPELLEAFEAIWAAMKAVHTPENLVQASIRETFFLGLLRHFSRSGDPRGRASENAIRKSIVFMNNNRGVNTSLEELAKLAGMAVRGYTEFFRKTTDCSPREYFNRRSRGRANCCGPASGACETSPWNWGSRILTTSPEVSSGLPACRQRITANNKDHGRLCAMGMADTTAAASSQAMRKENTLKKLTRTTTPRAGTSPPQRLLPGWIHPPLARGIGACPPMPTRITTLE